MSGQFFVWLLRLEETIAYLFTVAASVEDARLAIMAKLKEVKDTTTECVHWSEGVEYRYKSSPLGSSDGVLHLGGPNCMTSEEVCFQEKVVLDALKKEPLFVGNANSVGIVTAAAEEKS